MFHRTLLLFLLKSIKINQMTPQEKTHAHAYQKSGENKSHAELIGGLAKD